MFVGSQSNDVMVLSQNILDFALDYMGYVCNNPTKTKSKHHFLFDGIYLGITIPHIYLIFKYMYLEGKDVTTLSLAATSFTCYMQAFLTMIPNLYYRNTIIQLVYNRKNFWTCNLEEEPELHKDVSTTFRNTHVSLRFFCVMVAGTVVAFWMKPIFIKELFTVMYLPTFPHAFELILGVQYFYTPMLALMIFGMNTLYVSLCTDAVVQIKILMHKVKHIKNTKKISDLTQLKLCLEHHSFIIKYVELIQQVFNYPLLGQYVITMESNCMNVYTLMSHTQSKSDEAICLMYVGAISLQFVLFCFTATALASTMAELPDAYYFSSWEDGTKEYCKCLPFCIQRSQKEFYVKAGGLASINREAVTVLFKTSYSFALMLKNMKEEK